MLVRGKGGKEIFGRLVILGASPFPPFLPLPFNFSPPQRFRPSDHLEEFHGARSLLQRRPRVLRSGPPGYEWTGTEAVAVHFLCLSGQRLRRNIFGSIRRSDACSRPHHSGRRGTRLGSRECLAGGSILRDAVSSVHGRHRRQRVGLQPLADRAPLVRCRPCDCWRGASGHRARARCRRRRPRTPAGQR